MNSNSNSKSKSQKVKDIVDVVDENSKLKLFFGTTDDDDDDDDDDDVHIDHDVSSSASPPLSMKIILCSLIVISVTLVLHHMTTTTTSTTSASPPLDTMLNPDMELVGVQAQEQLPGKWCCPRNMDGCTSFVSRRTFCHTETLPNGTHCNARIGGHCCADSTASQYHWQFVNIGGDVGCVKTSF